MSVVSIVQDFRVSMGSDDAEERTSGSSAGRVDLGSSDLELIRDGSRDQTVGVRFTDVAIPPGVTITSASVQFTTDEMDFGSASLLLEGEKTPDAATFSDTDFDISSRLARTASVAWDNVPAWDEVGESSDDQKTPEIAPIIQEIVDQPGWALGNSLVIIVTGTGERTAESYDGSSGSAPLLHVEWDADFPLPEFDYVVNHTPYLQLGNAQLGAATDQIEVLWQTVPSGFGFATSDSFVAEYREAGASTWNDAGAISTIDTGVEDRVNHFVAVDGLAYDTDYEYRVTHNRGGALVTTYQDTFHTRLAEGDATSFSFAAYGDSAIGSAAGFRAVQDRINQVDAAGGIAFSLSLGDNAYNSGTHQEFDLRLDASINPEAAQYVASHVDYLTLGNHDAGTDSGQPELDNYSMPENGPAGETPEKNYSFDYGDVHIATFDSNSLNSAGRLDQQLTWLENDLEASSARWKIVFVHHPVAGSPDKGEDPGDNYYQQVVPRLRAAGADLFMAGHSHLYHRTYPLLGQVGGEAVFLEDLDNDYLKGAGFLQIVAGTGGAGLRPGNFDQYPFQAAGFSNDTTPSVEWGFAKVDVTPDVLTVSYVTADDGEILDSFTISAGADTFAPFALLTAPSDNGPGDFDPDDDQLVVADSPASFQIQLFDAGEGIADATVTSNTIRIERDGTLLEEGTDYTFGYDASLDLITLGPVGGGDFGDGIYEIGVSQGPGAKKGRITDVAGNKAVESSYRIVVDTSIPVLSFQQGENGYAGTEDTFLRSGSPDSDEGAEVAWEWDGNEARRPPSIPTYGLIQFDDIFGTNPGQLSEGSTILSATMTLYVFNNGNEGVVLEVERDWDESVTFNSFGPAPGVQSDDVRFTFVGTAPGGPGLQATDVTASIQSWAGDPELNDGWIVLPTGNDGVNVLSSEFGTSQLRPKLEVIVVTPVDATIDIKPGSDPNWIDPASQGKIPVAIFSTPDFNAPLVVDRDTLTFGRTGSEDSLSHATVEDVNGDGLPDLVGHFYTQIAGFQPGDTEGVLLGQTLSLSPIEGRDSVQIEPVDLLFATGYLSEDSLADDSDDDPIANALAVDQALMLME